MNKLPGFIEDFANLIESYNVDHGVSRAEILGAIETVKYAQLVVWSEQDKQSESDKIRKMQENYYAS